jgi:hypothetical protein
MSESITPIPDLAASTANAIQEIQALTDIEGDLADTAAAVASVDVDDDEEMLHNAEAVESVLEQSMPDGPGSFPEVSTGEVISPQTAHIPETMQLDESTIAPVSETLDPLDVAHIADEAVQSITESVPIDNDVPSAEIAPETEEPRVSLEAQSTVTISAPPTTGIDAQNGIPEFNGMSTNTVSILPPPTAATSLPFSVPGPTIQPTSIPPIARTPFSSLQSASAQVSLPEGLSEGSASVVSNPDLIRQWQSGEPPGLL